MATVINKQDIRQTAEKFRLYMSLTEKVKMLPIIDTVHINTIDVDYEEVKESELPPNLNTFTPENPTT